MEELSYSYGSGYWAAHNHMYNKWQGVKAKTASLRQLLCPK
jgi:hypothetical protein